MKKIYEMPVAEINELFSKDVITISVVMSRSTFDDAMDLEMLMWS